MTYDPHTDWGRSPALDEFAAAIAAAKRGEVLPESDAWLEANARTRPDWADDSAAEDIVRDRIEQRIDVDPRGDDRAADDYYERRAAR